MKIPFFSRIFGSSEAKPRSKRSFSSANSVVNGMFQAAASDRLNANWPSMPLPADEIVRRNQMVLVARSREQAINNDYVKAFLRLCRQNIVGPQGVVLQASSKGADGKLDQAANQAIEAAFDLWGKRKTCDVSGKRSWRAMQAQCVNSLARDGEYFIRKVYGADAGPWGFALQFIDPQRCPVSHDVYDLADGRFVRHGIEFNKFGRPLAYFFTIIDEDQEFYNYTYFGARFLRIPADEIIHGFKEDITGQKRGLPWTATSLFRARNMKGFEDAAVINARVGAAKMGFIKWQEGQGPDPDDEDDEIFIDAEAGTFPVLPSGADVVGWSPNFPNNETAIFSKLQLRGMAAGFGVLYNNLANDLEGVNFSSIRQGTLDERENWKGEQQELIEMLHEPVFEAWLEIALLKRLIAVKGRPLPAEKIEKYAEVQWQPRRWQWIDPRADVDAAVKAKESLLMSPGQIIRESGRDPLTVWKEIASDIEMMKAAGIPDEYVKASILPEQFKVNVNAEAGEIDETAKTAMAATGA